MDYNEFVNQLQMELQRCLGEAAKVAFHQITKNNGVCRDCLLISEKGQNVSPAIYLEEYFRTVKAGVEIRQIAEKIKKVYLECRGRVPLDAKMFEDFEKVKDGLLCRLINRDKNQKLLSKIPFVPYLDLAVVFYYMLETENFGSGTVLINFEHMKLWNVEQEELYQIARENTKHILPCRLYGMQDILQEMMTEKELLRYPFSEIPMYVLTNEKKYFGACGIMYDSVLEQAANKLKDSFYVLPSSVHECIVIPQEEADDPQELAAMVRDINRTQVLPEEILSDRIYHYDSKKHHLIM